MRCFSSASFMPPTQTCGWWMLSGSEQPEGGGHPAQARAGSGWSSAAAANSWTWASTSSPHGLQSRSGQFYFSGGWVLRRQMRQARRRNNPVRAIHCCLGLMNGPTWVVSSPDLAEAAIWRDAQDIPRYVFMIGKHLFFACIQVHAQTNNAGRLLQMCSVKCLKSRCQVLKNIQCKETRENCFSLACKWPCECVFLKYSCLVSPPQVFAVWQRQPHWITPTLWNACRRSRQLCVARCSPRARTGAWNSQPLKERAGSSGRRETSGTQPCESKAAFGSLPRNALEAMGIF